MDRFVGIDVSLDGCAVCVVAQSGAVVREAEVAREPEALIAFLREADAEHRRPRGRSAPAVASPASVRGRIPRRADGDPPGEGRAGGHADRDRPARRARDRAADPHGPVPAGPLQVGLRPGDARAVRARRRLKKATIGVELSMRRLLRGFGLELGKVARRRLPERTGEPAAGNETLTAMVTAMLRGHAALRGELARLETRLRRIARTHEVRRLLMTVPGVAPVVALQVGAGIDDPARFRSSGMIGPRFGLTPRRSQSGERDVVGAIGGAGDRNVRTAPFQAATAMLHHSGTKSRLKARGRQVARRRGTTRAVVAVARRLGVAPHRMWSDGRPVSLEHPGPAGAAA